ncbi:MAG: hypothetical protein ACRDYA_01670 [Egibacteraceae bacterium]
MRAHELRVGDRVRVRSRDEVLATLDENGTVAGMPFMPEMLAFSGRTFTVDAITHRTCDTVKTSGTSGTTRSLPGTVHLCNVRCDGTAHGGCQARCLLYWKEEWLERVSADDAPAAPDGDGAPRDVPPLLAQAARGEGHTEEAPVYACQATQMLSATCFISARDVRPLVKDVRSHNATAREALVSFAVLVFNKWQSLSARLPRWLRVHGGASWPWYDPTGEKRRYPPLNLQPGDLVEVGSRAEIESTLDEGGALRGLRFGAEMLPYCGKRARVLAKVERIIDEKTGRMLELRDCVILEDVWCEGTYRLLCRRKIYTYWRESWLRLVERATAPPS